MPESSAIICERQFCVKSKKFLHESCGALLMNQDHLSAAGQVIRPTDASALEMPVLLQQNGSRIMQRVSPIQQPKL